MNLHLVPSSAARFISFPGRPKMVSTTTPRAPLIGPVGRWVMVPEEDKKGGF
jgi:hypothetical protein